VSTRAGRIFVPFRLHSFLIPGAAGLRVPAVASLLAQYDGMAAGYASTSQPPLPAFAWQLLNGVGDLCPGPPGAVNRP
jgi:hypothetical protein